MHSQTHKRTHTHIQYTSTGSTNEKAALTLSLTMCKCNDKLAICVVLTIAASHHRTVTESDVAPNHRKPMEQKPKLRAQIKTERKKIFFFIHWLNKHVSYIMYTFTSFTFRFFLSLTLSVSVYISPSVTYKHAIHNGFIRLHKHIYGTLKLQAHFI